ncbi:MAG: chemotaxis protein MotB [Paraglaciecola sp.]|jgi:chemotaxis protein MotB
MNTFGKIFLLFFVIVMTSSCVSKKVLEGVQSDLEKANSDLGKCGEDLNAYMTKLSACEQEKTNMKTESRVRAEQMKDLRDQIEDLKKQRQNQVEQVGDLTVLSQSASSNIDKTLSQLASKDKYIRLIQAAKTKADSINLVLAVNLKSVLSKGIDDEDVEVKVDKTVVFINLSDKMLYESGSYKITSRADEVLGKIATIVKSRPGFEVMVEGYTDNDPIKTECIRDNWDLSVLRSTSVVRALKEQHSIDPNRLIAAGRGEFNTLASNATADGKSTNRRTRIIIMPKLDQFYDLLNPDKMPN